MYFPSSHVAHTAEPSVATCVLLHDSQVALEVAPGDAEAVSAGHGVHAVLPVGSAVYVPALHCTQCDARKCAVNPPVVVPAWHSTQKEMSVALGVVEYLPLAHSVHAALPVAALCLPASHAEHEPPLGPVQPALQVHKFVAAPVPGVLELDEQPVHDACPDASL